MHQKSLSIKEQDFLSPELSHPAHCTWLPLGQSSPVWRWLGKFWHFIVQCSVKQLLTYRVRHLEGVQTVHVCVQAPTAKPIGTIGSMGCEWITITHGTSVQWESKSTHDFQFLLCLTAAATHSILSWGLLLDSHSTCVCRVQWHSDERNLDSGNFKMLSAMEDWISVSGVLSTPKN